MSVSSTLFYVYLSAPLPCFINHLRLGPGVLNEFSVTCHRGSILNSILFFFSFSFHLDLVYATAMGPQLSAQLSAAVAAQVQLAVAGGNSPTTPPVVSPMANLMSITDTLPPGSPRNGPSPPQQAPQRSASRGSQHSTHSSGTDTLIHVSLYVSTFICVQLKGGHRRVVWVVYGLGWQVILAFLVAPPHVVCRLGNQNVPLFLKSPYNPSSSFVSFQDRRVAVDRLVRDMCLVRQSHRQMPTRRQRMRQTQTVQIRWDCREPVDRHQMRLAVDNKRMALEAQVDRTMALQ